MKEKLSARIGLLLAAAGSGSRFGSSRPKQFLETEGKPIFYHALAPFLSFVDEVVVVVPLGWEAEIRAVLEQYSTHSFTVCCGGPSRQDSVWRGLQRFDSKTTHVFVHDAARPYVSKDLIKRVLEMTLTKGACLPILPVRDTVKEIVQGKVTRTIPRESLGLAQTPQGFALEILLRASERAREENFEGTDEASLVEFLGETVHTVDGEWSNVKLTWTHDLPEAAELQHLSTSRGDRQ